jgi:hypothetical protein
MPRGEEEEIAVRDGGDFRFVVLSATRALLERRIEPVILIRNQQNLMANIFNRGVGLELRPRLAHTRISSWMHASNPIGPYHVA